MNQQQPRKRRRRFLWVLGGLVLVLLVLALGGFIYQDRATAADRARYTPPGELVTVDGRQMHLNCSGEDGLTVILDAGQGGWSSDWADIFPRLSYAARHPDDVVGLVLIDPATEFDNELLGEEGMRQQRSALSMFGALGAASRIGLVRALEPQEIAPYAPFIAQDPTQPDVYFSFVSEPCWWATSRAEFEARLSDEALEHVSINGNIRDIPVVIVAAEASAGNPEVDPARHQRLEELTAQSMRGRFVLAEDSSHDVVQERPELVVEAILEVVDSAGDR